MLYRMKSGCMLTSSHLQQASVDDVVCFIRYSRSDTTPDDGMEQAPTQGWHGITP